MIDGYGTRFISFVLAVRFLIGKNLLGGETYIVDYVNSDNLGLKQIKP